VVRIEQGGTSSPEPGNKVEGLHIPPGIIISGWAALGAVLGVAVNEVRKRKKRASEDPETKKNYGRQ